MTSNISENRAASQRRTEPRDVRRTQLINATIQSIAKNGIGGTTISSVTEIAGMSIGFVNFHFKSKQNLFEETIIHLAREHHDHWQHAHDNAGLGPADKLLAIVDAHFDPVICAPDKLAVWFAFYGEVGRRAVYRKLIDDIDDERLSTSIQLLNRIIADADHTAALPPAQIALQLEALYDGLWLNILLYPDLFPLEQARKQLRAFLATALPGLFDMPLFDLNETLLGCSPRS
jgi:TetR/AcrR family transcriptional repressor of bet genes